MEKPSGAPGTSAAVLLAMTAVTGVVDAVSFLGMGRVFTANMTGNTVLLGFALGGASGLSVSRSSVALLAFLAGALAGGRMMSGPSSGRWVSRTFLLEALLLALSAAVAIQSRQPFAVIGLTAVAMGMRNAVVRKLAIPDLTTTVLTLTITGIAADSSLARGDNPRWRRRLAAIIAMTAGAAAGARMLTHSLSLPLAVCSVVMAGCGAAQFTIESKRGQS